MKNRQETSKDDEMKTFVNSSHKIPSNFEHVYREFDSHEKKQKVIKIAISVR